MPDAFEYSDAAHIVTLLLMYVRRILRSERVSQEILLIARGESKLISTENNAHPQTVNAWITPIDNSNAKLRENRRAQVRGCWRTTRDSSRCEM